MRPLFRGKNYKFFVHLTRYDDSGANEKIKIRSAPVVTDKIIHVFDVNLGARIKGMFPS